MLNLTSTAADQTGLPGFALYFSPGLGVSGTVQVGGIEATCNNAACAAPTGTTRFVVSEGTATAQVTFAVRYAANLGQGESYIDIINDGLNGAPLLGPGMGPAIGNICVNVYAFDQNEEMISCCSCLVTADQARNLGVNRDITSNTATQVIPTSVTIKLLSTLAGASGTPADCSQGGALVNTATLVGGFEAFGTTLHAQGTGFVTTETPFRNASLSVGELLSLANRCANIVGNLSKFGQCASCQKGSLAGGKL